MSIRLNNRAHQKEITLNPLKILEAINIIHALITNKNKPKVTRVAGRVKKIKTGRKKAFKTPIITATHIAYIKLSTTTPGKILASKKTANAVNNNFKNHFIKD